MRTPKIDAGSATLPTPYQLSLPGNYSDIAIQRIAFDKRQYQSAIQIFCYFTLSGTNGALNPKGVKMHLVAHRLPHSFYPVGDGQHVIPVDRNGHPLAYPSPISEYDMFGPLLRRFWLPIAGIDWKYLILGNFLWMDIDGLLSQSAKARGLFTVRCYRALDPLGFPFPKMSPGAYRTADIELHREIKMMGAQA